MEGGAVPGLVGSVLAEDPAAAPAVREAFTRAAAGCTIASIARWIRALPEEAPAGHQFADATVSWMLRAGLRGTAPPG